MGINKYEVGQKIVLTDMNTVHRVLEVTTPYCLKVGMRVPLYKLSGLPSAIRVSEDCIQPPHLGVVSE